MEGETTRGRNDSGRNDSGRTRKWAKLPVTAEGLAQNIQYVQVRVCVCVFEFNVAFNNFSVISRRCLVATGSSMLTFIVLPH